MGQASGIPEVPIDMPRHHRDFFTSLRNAITRLESSRSPVRPPTNFKVTPVAGGNVIQFTRSDGDSYILYSSSTPDFSKATAYQLGSVQQYSDNIGAGAIKKFYWLQAVKSTGTFSPLVGPLSSTTLALNVAATIPPPPPANDAPVTNQTTNTPDYEGAGRNNAI